MQGSLIRHIQFAPILHTGAHARCLYKKHVEELTKKFEVGFDQVLAHTIDDDDFSKLRDARGSVYAKLQIHWFADGLKGDWRQGCCLLHIWRCRTR